MQVLNWNRHCRRISRAIQGLLELGADLLFLPCTAQRAMSGNRLSSYRTCSPNVRSAVFMIAILERRFLDQRFSISLFGGGHGRLLPDSDVDFVD